MATWLLLLLAPTLDPDSAPLEAWRLRGQFIRPGMPRWVAEAILDGDIVAPGQARVKGRTDGYVKAGVFITWERDEEGRQTVGSVKPLWPRK